MLAFERWEERRRRAEKSENRFKRLSENNFITAEHDEGNTKVIRNSTIKNAKKNTTLSLFESIYKSWKIIVYVVKNHFYTIFFVICADWLHKKESSRWRSFSHSIWIYARQVRCEILRKLPIFSLWCLSFWFLSYFGWLEGVITIVQSPDLFESIEIRFSSVCLT
jgi:hypothetical protein